MANEWQGSTVEHAPLADFEAEELLLPSYLVSWWAPEGEAMPNPRSHERVLFTSFLERELSVPVGPFIQRFLYWHGI